MKWFGKDAEGQARVLGMPVSGLWLGHSDAALDGFEPENPRFFIPRKYGLGWDVNLGAAGVRLGLIRPDDSLPDLANYVPTRLKRGIRLTTIAGGIGVTFLAVLVSRKEQVLLQRSTRGGSERFITGRQAALAPVVLTTVAALAPQVFRHDDPESEDAVRLANQADLMGVEAMSIAWLAAMRRAGDKRKMTRRSMVPIVALWPLVAGACQLAYVKTALARVKTRLHNSGDKQ
ncbi:DUF5808 domain-containing protein [Varibaculum cambriense]|uniref:DUF5808 domain-containing protein n=1 Tax=Varibaculum cambriense TaxID=184870 RepID=UPI0039F4BAF3